MKFGLLMFCLTTTLTAAPVWAAAGPSEREANGEYLTEANKKLTSPVSDFWSISFLHLPDCIFQACGTG